MTMGARLGVLLVVLVPVGCGGGGDGGGGGGDPPVPPPLTSFTPGTTAVPTPSPFYTAPFVLEDVAFTTLGDDDAVLDLFYVHSGMDSAMLSQAQESLQGFGGAVYGGGYGGSGWGPGPVMRADAGDVIGPGLGGGVFAFESPTILYVGTWGQHFEGANRAGVGGTETVLGGHAGPLAVGDFDADGIDDVAVADPPASSVHTFLSQGASGIDPAVTTALPPASDPTTIATLDVDGDLDLDIVCGDGGGGFRVLRSDGDGTFTPVANPGALGGAARRIELLVGGLFDGDDRADLAGVIEDGGVRSLFTMHGNGNGTFATPVLTSLGGPAATAAGARIRTADFNLDGIPDVAFVVPSASQVYVVLGDGAGGWRDNPDDDFMGAGPCDSLAIGDLDDDGDVDLGVVDATGFVVRLLLNDAI
jgi:hypothetical protein